MTTKTVYLAGPISGLSYQGCTDWRHAVKRSLYGSVRCLSPLRAKDYLSKEVEIADHYAEHPLSCQRGIMTRDRYDTMSCDIVLANLLGATRVSIGTMMEIAWADMLRKPIIIVMEKEGNLHDHAMVREAAGFRVETLDKAVEIIRAIADTAVDPRQMAD